MQAFITPNTVANQARMRNPKDKAKVRVFIEGKDDYRIYQNLIDGGSCILIPSTGKTNAIGAVQVLRKEGWTGVLALVDRDFDALNGIDVSGPNVVVTDYHDAEMMLFGSRALEKLLLEYGVSVEADDARKSILEAARSLGYLRWVSIQRNYRLDFENLDIAGLIGEKMLELDIECCAAALIMNTKHCALSKEQVSATTKSAMNGAHDLWQLCCGHDVVGALAVVVGRQIGRDTHPATVARGLRLAFEHAFFSVTKIYAAIRAWEDANKGWRVLRSA